MDIRFGDIVQVDLGETVGSIQGGKRPCVVVQNDIGNRVSPTTIVIPLTSEIKKLHMRTHDVLHKTEANGLDGDSLILGEQVCPINKKAILYKRGFLDDNEINKVINVYIANLPRKGDGRINRETNRAI